MKLSIIYLSVIILLFFYLIFGHNGVLKYREMVRLQYVYEERIHEMDNKIDMLERELALMKQDNAYLEYVIRRELGIQKPDEDQYIIKHE